ncbi:MAG: SH3 domain-containing protein [Kiloniellaceae bacterium]
MLDLHSLPSPLRFLSLVALLAAALSLLGAPPTMAQQAAEGVVQSEAGRPAAPGRTGLPLPRFVTLRADEVNLRTGPGTRYPIDWVYRRRGLPVEIVDEFDTWRRIRDWQGTEGWVHQSMVQGQRGILVTGKRHALRRRPEPNAPGVALVDAGVVGVLQRCQVDWCEVTLDSFTGWLPRDAFYGLYPGEAVE